MRISPKSFQNKPNRRRARKAHAGAPKSPRRYKPLHRRLAPPAPKGKVDPMRVLPALLCALVLAGCGSSNDGAREMDTGTSAIASGSTRVTLGVNSYLWHAPLDTLSFLPLVSADPFGGVIISEWYVAPSSPDERLKVTVYIMDRALRA